VNAECLLHDPALEGVLIRPIRHRREQAPDSAEEIGVAQDAILYRLPFPLYADSL
jgi:hypothetical protein